MKKCLRREFLKIYKGFCWPQPPFAARVAPPVQNQIPIHSRGTLWKRTARGAFAFLLLLGVGRLFAASPTVPDLVQSSIRQRVTNGYNPGIAVGIVDANGRGFFSFGVARLDTGQPITEATLFEIGSVTKAITATLLANLVQTGEVSLSDPVRTYLPSTVLVPSRNGVEITLEHLATHTSALPYVPPNLANADPENPFADFSVEALYDLLNTYQLPRDPGTRYEYSNVAVGLLGHALALRGGKSYEELLRERLLDPLGMSETRIRLTPEQIGRRATGYSGVVARPPFEMASLEGAGALYSSVGDMLTFLEFSCGLRTNSLSAVFANAATMRRATDIPGLNIGLGWWLLPISGDTVVFHEGNTMGQTAFVGYRRNPKKAVVVLTNARVNQPANVEEIGLNLLGVISSLTAIPNLPVVPLQSLRAYQGIYTNIDGTFFDMRFTNNFLTFSFSNASNLFSTLYQTNARTFNVLDLGVQASSTFATNSSGLVTELVWKQSGRALTYLRQTNPSRLMMTNSTKGMELALHGDSQVTYTIEESVNFRDWRAFATNSIWTNRIPVSTALPTRFYRSVAR
jgi:D-alanyl-D-alanine-carboxypeptidase/D-alanyl-D-alanine-endopeptidase